MLKTLVTGYSSGAVNEDEDHSAESPGDAEDAYAVAGTIEGLLLVSDDGGYGHVEEEQGSDELGDEGPVEGPELELGRIEEWRRWWVDVVLAVVVGLTLLAHFLRHDMAR